MRGQLAAVLGVVVQSTATTATMLSALSVMPRLVQVGTLLTPVGVRTQARYCVAALLLLMLDASALAVAWALMAVLVPVAAVTGPEVSVTVLLVSLMLTLLIASEPLANEVPMAMVA